MTIEQINPTAYYRPSEIAAMNLKLGPKGGHSIRSIQYLIKKGELIARDPNAKYKQVSGAELLRYLNRQY